MLSIFSDKIDLDRPRNEYPRPQLVRDSYLSLNGSWEFTGAPTGRQPDSFPSEITVPYDPACELSGIEMNRPMGYVLWYRRRFSFAEDFVNGRVLLHFGSIAGSARLWINGVQASLTEQGSAYTADITDALQSENEILLCIERDKIHWLTAEKNIGIVSDVWCECVPDRYIRGLTMVPHNDLKRLELTVFPSDEKDIEAPCFVTIRGNKHEIRAGIPYFIDVDDAELWTPDTPILHEIELLFGTDKAKSYFAMREFATGMLYDHGCFMLNNNAVFLNGVNYSCLWPDCHRTVPSDDALVFDVQNIKQMGFNAIRLTSIPEDDRFYYHCDRLGLMVVQVLPSGEKALAAALLRLQSHPCIVLWEMNGKMIKKGDMQKISGVVFAADCGRMLHIAGIKKGSPCVIRSSELKKGKAVRIPQGRTVHYYSEMGSFGYVLFGHTENEKSRAGRKLDSPQLYHSELDTLYNETLSSARREGLAGCFYSRYADEKTRCDGLMSSDRMACKINAGDVRAIISALNSTKK